MVNDTINLLHITVAYTPAAAWLSAPAHPCTTINAFWNDGNTESSHTLAEFFAIDLIAIPQQKAWGSFFREYFHDLLSCPSSRRMFGHIEMRHTPVNR